MNKPSRPSLRFQACFSSASDEWPTPLALFQGLDAEFGFTLDPCATVKNAKCNRFFSRTDDGLVQDWSGETVFMNPPYGRVIGQWVAKAHATALTGATVVCLLPARTDARWWHHHVMRAAEIRFLQGRVTFEGGKHPAPFPSAVVVFRPSRPRLVSVQKNGDQPELALRASASGD